MAKDGDIIDVMFGWIISLFGWLLGLVVKLGTAIIVGVVKYGWLALCALVAFIIGLFKKKEDLSDIGQPINEEQTKIEN